MAKSIVEYPGLSRKGGAGIAAPAQRALLHAVVVAVRHVDLALGVHRHSPRPVEVPVIASRFVQHPQRGLIDAVAAEDLDTLVAAVDHIDIPIYRADRHASRTLEFVITVAAAPKGDYIVPISIINLNPVMAVWHINPPACVDSDVAR